MLRELEPEDPDTERMIRNSFRWQWSGVALMLTTLLLSFILPENDESVLLVLLAIAVVVALYAGLKVREADGATTPRYYLDVRSKRWRFSLVNMLIFGLIGVRQITQFSDRHDLSGLVLGILWVLLPSASLVMGPKDEFDDEIIRLLRSRAMQVGYVTALLVLVSVMAVALYYPAYLMTAFAWGLFASTAVPIIAYVVLDWISDRGADV